MYNVLLVDDEILDLEGLERFTPWNKLNMNVVAMANSGFEALRILDKQSIDLLITDIRMPIMSGIELGRQALEIQPNIKIIIISGYEDFNSAKQAISLNALGYILKPVDDKEVLHVLEEAKISLDTFLHQRQISNALEQSMPFMWNELFQKWLEGADLSPPLIEMFKSSGILKGSGLYGIVIFELDDILWKMGNYSDKERKNKIDQECHRLQSLCREEGMIYFCRIDDHRIASLMHAKDMRVRLDRIILKMRQGFLTVTAAVGAEVEVESIPSSYPITKSMLSYKFFYGKDRIIEQFDTCDQLDAIQINLDYMLQIMFTAMSNYELVKIDDCIEDFFDHIRSLGKKLSVYHVVVHMITKLDSFLVTMNENLQSILGIEPIKLDVIYHFETIKELKSWFRRRVFEISEVLHRKNMKKNRKIAVEIIHFIEDKINQDFTLRDVANHLSFSPNYLGRIFRDETGENFSDFVIRKRLEKAQELLGNPKLKIYEVADLVGYKQLTYFSRQFREAFGMTPGDFRRKS